MTSDLPAEQLRLGFACSWWHPREPTWSYTPAALQRALSEHELLSVTSIDAQLPLLGKAALKLAYSYSDNAWKQGRLNRWYAQRKILRAALRSKCDAVLAMSSTEPVLPVPTYFYQDMGYGLVRSYDDRSGHRCANLGPVAASRLDILAAEEAESYRACAGVFTMSTWFARWLTDVGGLPQEKVHPVGGGINARTVGRRTTQTGPLRGRLLFVGQDFLRKGGDVVLDAVASLRASGSGDYRLTVVGPSAWPLDGAPPDWVDFQGSLSPSAVGQLWAEHDVFVLPSRFEAYGLTFLEARAGGLPCVGRRAFAMPELIPEGAGALVAEDAGVEEVAEAIHSVSIDEALFEQVAHDAAAVARDNSWHAVAARMLEVMCPTLGRTAPHASDALD